jgi:hypothetical protein
MATELNWTALGVFAFFFALVTVIGFAASRWQRGRSHKALTWTNGAWVAATSAPGSPGSSSVAISTPPTP